MRVTLTTIVLACAYAVAHAQAPVATQLTLVAPSDAVQGETIVLEATLSDAAGAPVTGEWVVFSVTLPFFDYVSTVEVGRARTNFRGMATLSFTPTVEAERRLMAAFAGAEGRAPSDTWVPLTVAHGVLPEATRPPGPVLPGLTRGRATAFLLPAILGVWVIFGYAVYQMTRIALEGRDAIPVGGAKAGD